MIGKRVSEISCDEHEFEKAKGDYNKALEKSGFSENIKYYKQGPVKRTRTRKVIWFNPPYNSHVKTNVGKTSMKLIIKHCPKHDRYHKIFNKNTIKLSYSCMPNMGSILTKPNNKLLFRSLLFRNFSVLFPILDNINKIFIKSFSIFLVIINWFIFFN